MGPPLDQILDPHLSCEECLCTMVVNYVTRERHVIGGWLWLDDLMLLISRVLSPSERERNYQSFLRCRQLYPHACVEECPRVAVVDNFILTHPLRNVPLAAVSPHLPDRFYSVLFSPAIVLSFLTTRPPGWVSHSRCLHSKIGRKSGSRNLSAAKEKRVELLGEHKTGQK